MEKYSPQPLRQVRRAILIQTGSRRQPKQHAARRVRTVSNSHYLKNLGFVILVLLEIQPTLHLLVYVGTVKDIGTLHSLAVALDFGGLVVGLRTEIP